MRRNWCALRENFRELRQILMISATRDSQVAIAAEHAIAKLIQTVAEVTCIALTRLIKTVSDTA
jgi:hypothetical protein